MIATGARPIDDGGSMLPVEGGSIERLRRSRLVLCHGPSTPSEVKRPGPGEGEGTMERVRYLYSLARRRHARLGPMLATDGPWHMLLDLFLAHGQGRPLSVTAACLGSLSPTSTGHRYLALIVERGLARRIDDPADGRRSYVELTEEGFALVNELVEPA